MVYRFTAYTIDKRIVEGTIEAASESLAEEALYRAGHQRVLSLKEVRSGISREQLLPSFFGVKAQEVIDFSRKLATFIESGITILTALELLKDHTSRRALRKVISGLVDELFQTQEVFLTNSLIEIMPLTEIDGKSIGSGRLGPVTRRLMTDYRKLVLASRPSEQ